MPVVLLTLHAYASWMPDRREGSVHWKRGYQPPSHALAQEYRYKQREAGTWFTARIQRIAIEALLKSCPLQSLKLHGVASDGSHFHILLSWRDAREARRIQSRLKHSLTQALNRQSARRNWFTKGGHRRLIRSREHFQHLRDEYLPSHAGLLWHERFGIHRRDGRA